MSVKRRLIFTLLYSDGCFMLSRNFHLQRAGNIDWLERHYSFDRTAQAIDELVVLNVSSEEEGFERFAAALKSVVKAVFVPVTAGGWIQRPESAHELLNSGADKLILNTMFIERPALVEEFVSRYGSQCIVASIDVSARPGRHVPFIQRGKQDVDISLSEHMSRVESLGAGEIYLNSIDRDGTGRGFDLSMLSQVPQSFKLPIIIAGGAGNAKHFLDAFMTGSVDAVATANIFNFVGNGLLRARDYLLSNGIQMASIFPVGEVPKMPHTGTDSAGKDMQS